jgi:hypothetical protein
VYLLVFIQNLLMHLAEKILLMQPLTFGGDYQLTVVEPMRSAASRPDPPRSRRLSDHMHRSGRKTFVQQAKSADPYVRWQATWGMSDQHPEWSLIDAERKLS